MLHTTSPYLPRPPNVTVLSLLLFSSFFFYVYINTGITCRASVSPPPGWGGVREGRGGAALQDAARALLGGRLISSSLASLLRARHALRPTRLLLALLAWAQSTGGRRQGVVWVRWQGSREHCRHWRRGQPCLDPCTTPAHPPPPERSGPPRSAQSGGTAGSRAQQHRVLAREAV